VPVKAVIDTNIWIRALLKPGIPRQIADTLEADLFTLICSKELLEELERVWKRPQIAVKISEGHARRLITLIKTTALFVELQHIPAVSRDPKDDIFLACAALSQSDFLVSADDDLLCLASHEHTQIVTPREFLEIITSRE
jgi:uncharacterized protein